jgi:hypothetical protein
VSHGNNSNETFYQNVHSEENEEKQAESYHSHSRNESTIVFGNPLIKIVEEDENRDNYTENKQQVRKPIKSVDFGN